MGSVNRKSSFVNQKWFWKGCKPNSVCALAGGENHLSGQPIPGIRPLSRNRSGPLRDSLFGLAPDGVFRAASLALRAVVSYTTFSPLPASLAKHRRYNFLWHCPSESLSASRPRVSQSNGLGLRGIAPFGVRTFLFRLAPKAILRPSKTTSKIRDVVTITRLLAWLQRHDSTSVLDNATAWFNDFQN